MSEISMHKKIIPIKLLYAINISYLYGMGRKRSFEIKENLTELESYKSRVKDYRSSQRIKALLLVKEGEKTLVEISGLLEIHFTTLERWIKDYQTQGIEKYLGGMTRNKTSKIITPTIHLEIEERLKNSRNPFSGYVEVQQWLLKEHGVEIEYQWLWKYMTTKMNSKLKVPRKTNVKKDPQAEETFFKTAPNA